MKQQSDAVKKVLLTDNDGYQLMDKNHNSISTREYHDTHPDGFKIVIQKHSAGHKYGPPSNQGPHFNPRKYDYETGHDFRNKSVDDLPEHYNFPKGQ